MVRFTDLVDWRSIVHEIRRIAMDRQVDELQKKLKGLLTEAAEVSVALDRANGTIQGVPHYSVIELRAHDLGQQLRVYL